MKQKTKNQPARKPESPFVPQKRMSDSPQLRFQEPEETADWLLSREKTDYTYSRSASYSSSASQAGTLRRVANSYETPIMSRTAQDGVELLPQTPHSTAPNHRYSTRSSARRSNRLAGQHGAQYDATPMRGKEQTTYRTSRTSRTTTRKYNESPENPVNGHDSGIFNRSGAMSAASHSGLLSEQNQVNRSLQNIYGLDGNESDYSEGESQLASPGSSTTTFSTITTTTTTTTTSSTWLQRQESNFRQQHGLIPFIIRCIFTALTAVETVVTTMVSRTTKTGGAAGSSVGHWASSILGLFGEMVRWLLRSLSFLLTRLYSAFMSFWRSAWLYYFLRQPVSTFLHGVPREESEGMHTSSSTYVEQVTVIERERERRKGGLPFCCFCLPLLLLLMLLSSATTGRYFFFPFLAANETKGESLLHPITQQFLLLRDSVGYYTSPSPSPAPPPDSFLGGLGAEGCIKCLKQDQLMGWIDLTVQREVGDMRLRLNTLNDQVSILQQLRGQQANAIQSLQSQLADSLAANSDAPPSKLTMNLINSLESQITDLKASQRILQIKVESSDTEINPAALTLKRDFTTLSDSLAGLKGSLQRLHAKCAADVQHAQSAHRKQQGGVNLLSASMLTLTQKIAEVEGLELTLIQLKREMESLNTKDGHHSTQLAAIVANINSVEGSLTAIRGEMREMQFNVTEATSGSGASTSQVSALYVEVSQVKQELTEMRMKHVGYDRSIEGLSGKHASLVTAAGVMETDLAELRSSVNNLMSGDLNSILERLSQLQTRLASIETDNNQLQVSLNTIQSSRTVHQSGESSGTNVDKDAIAVMQVNVNKVNTQIAGLQTDIASIHLKLTELKSTTAHTTQSVESHSLQLAALFQRVGALERSLNDSVVILPGSGGVPQPLISIHDMNALKQEMDSVHIAINKLKTDLASETASGIAVVSAEINSLTSKLDSVQGRLNQAKLEASLANLDGSLKDLKQNQGHLADDLATVQLNTGLLQKQTARGNGEAIQLSVLESRLNDLATSVQGVLDSGATPADPSVRSPTTGCTSTQNIDWVKGDIAALRETLASISAILFAKDCSEKSTSTFLASVQERLGQLDAALVDVRASSRGDVSDDVKASIAALQEEVKALVIALGRLEANQEEFARSSAAAAAAGLGLGGLGGAGSLTDDDLCDLKANVSQLQQLYAHLQVDVVNCCKNKSGAAAFPWFGSASSSSGGGAAGVVGGDLDEDRVKSIVLGALDMYNADKTGMVDYALESAGGSVISIRCSETYAFKTALISLFGIPIWYSSNSPRTVIQPDVHPGNCWAFKGTQGYVVVQLANTIKPTAFSMEHIPKTLDPTGNIDSAPKNFSVWGIRDEYDRDGFLLGTYSYNRDGTPLQFFPVQNTDYGPVPMVELKIESNYGNMEYTCLYRFRVHGVLHR